MAGVAAEKRRTWFERGCTASGEELKVLVNLGGIKIEVWTLINGTRLEI